MAVPDFVERFLDGDSDEELIEQVREWAEKRVRAMRQGGLAARGKSGRKPVLFTEAARRKRERERDRYRDKKS